MVEVNVHIGIFMKFHGVIAIYRLIIIEISTHSHSVSAIAHAEVQLNIQTIKNSIKYEAIKSEPYAI